MKKKSLLILLFSLGIFLISPHLTKAQDRDFAPGNLKYNSVVHFHNHLLLTNTSTFTIDSCSSINVLGESFLNKTTICTDLGALNVYGENAVQIQVEAASYFKTTNGDLSIDAVNNKLYLDGGTGVNIAATNVLTSILGSLDLAQNATFHANLDVDGITNLDRVNIVTNDGKFDVSGSNPIEMTVSNSITLQGAASSSFSTTSGTLTLDGASTTYLSHSGQSTNIRGSALVNQTLEVDNNLYVDGTPYFRNNTMYIGNGGTGTWRIQVNGTNLEFHRYDGSSWNLKARINQ